jgi:hypothetical protein
MDSKKQTRHREGRREGLGDRTCSFFQSWDHVRDLTAIPSRATSTADEAETGFARAALRSVWKRPSPGTSPALAFRLRRCVDSGVVRECGESNGSAASLRGAVSRRLESPMSAESRLRAAANSSSIPSMLASSHRSSGLVSHWCTFKTAPLHYDRSILWPNALLCCLS